MNARMKKPIRMIATSSRLCLTAFEVFLVGSSSETRAPTVPKPEAGKVVAR